MTAAKPEPLSETEERRLRVLIGTDPIVGFGSRDAVHMQRLLATIDRERETIEAIAQQCREQCARADRERAARVEAEMHGRAIADAAERMRAHEKTQDELLRAAIARAERAEDVAEERRNRAKTAELRAEAAERKLAEAVEDCAKAVEAYAREHETYDDDHILSRGVPEMLRASLRGQESR